MTPSQELEYHIQIRNELRPITIKKQGKLFEVKAHKSGGTPPTKKLGAVVKGFSAAARLRMLKFIATVDWSPTLDGRFITLTYPDDQAMRTRKERNNDRARFFRYMEKYLGKKVEGIWRLEWKKRKSGRHKGKLAPHFHIILPTVGWLPYKKIHLWWRKAIRATRPVSCKVEVIVSGKQIGLYIAKYLAKWSGPPNLDNPLLLNSNGRHYGYVRKELIPRCPIRWINGLGREVSLALMSLGAERLEWITGDKIESFTILGDEADEIEKEIDEIRIDLERERG